MREGVVGSGVTAEGLWMSDKYTERGSVYCIREENSRGMDARDYRYGV